MPKTTDAQRKAIEKYDRQNTRQYHLKLNRNTDADIMARLDEVDSIQGYIKQLIRADIEKNHNFFSKKGLHF